MTRHASPVDGGPARIFGLRLVENDKLMVDKSEQVVRTRHERWFSWPWRPWRKTRTVIRRAPDPTFYKTPDSIVAHPETMARLKREIAELNRRATQPGGTEA